MEIKELFKIIEIGLTQSCKEICDCEQRCEKIEQKVNQIKKEFIIKLKAKSISDD